MSDGGRSEDEIKRRRAIRSGLAAILAIGPFLMLIFQPGSLRTWGLGWPVEWQIFFVVSLAASVWLGWKPCYETWFGDQSIYVDEPEVDDDW